MDSQDNQTNKSPTTAHPLLKPTTIDVLTLAFALHDCTRARKHCVFWGGKKKFHASKLYWINYLAGCDGTQKTAHGASGLHLSQIIPLYQTAR